MFSQCDWFRPPARQAAALSVIDAAMAAGVPMALRCAIESLSVPAIVSGTTGERFETLAEVAAIDLSLGRVFEGHCDALDIISQAGLEPLAGVYGVWAAQTSALQAIETTQGWQLTGAKPYCSGAPFLDRALVSAMAGDESLLFEVQTGTGIAVVEGSWPSVGMAASKSYSVEFAQAPVVRQVGGPGFYTQRPGFWQGSLNVPACWFGGALGLARGLLPYLNGETDTHRLAAFGALSSEIEAMRTLLSTAGLDTDLDPLDSEGRAKARALSTRHLVYEASKRAMELAAVVGGTGGFTRDAAQSRRLADLPVYLRQHHPGPDAEALGRMAIERYADA